MAQRELINSNGTVEDVSWLKIPQKVPVQTDKTTSSALDPPALKMEGAFGLSSTDVVRAEADMYYFGRRTRQFR